MKNGIKFIIGKGLEDALQIQDLDEAKEYLKDFANILNYSINSLESAFINIFDKIRFKSIIELDNSKYKIWLDAYYEIRQEKEIKNPMTMESRLIKRATDDLLDFILKNDLESLEFNQREIMNKAYFLKELTNLIKKEKIEGGSNV
jgi:hypothetical protein